MGSHGWQLSVCTKNCYDHLVEASANEAMLSATGSSAYRLFNGGVADMVSMYGQEKWINSCKSHEA